MIERNLNDSAANLTKVSTVLLSDLREDVFFSRLSGFLKEYMNEDRIEIALVYNDESTQLIARDGEIVSGAKIQSRGEGAAGYVTKTKKIYYSNSVQRDPLFSSDDKDPSIHSEIIVPVMIEGKPMATIHVQSFEEGRKYDESDATRVRSFINDHEVALSNMNLYLMAKFLNRELLNKIKEQTSNPSGFSSASHEEAREKLEIIGQDTSLLQALAMAKRVATQDIPVLIEGKAGVGKRLMAKKVHELSNRRGMSCQVVECATLNEGNLEREIFGWQAQKGALELNNNGTVIFNDISELSLRLQTRILDFLTTGRIKRLESDELLSLNVRVIVTSQKHLRDLVAHKKFRGDLFYRLATVQMTLPSLRERGDDIKILANHFLNLGKSSKKYLTEQAVCELKELDWEGNILELRNTMERTYALSEGKYIDKVEIGDFNFFNEESEKEAKKNQETEAFEPITLQEIEKRHICKTLEHLGGNKTRAAKSLGITVKTLYNKLHSYGLISKDNN